ncbi:Uncharacterised protein [Mycobacterium tuberculosis]|nr:Uncharacterised protein [Mycobacterium tuberculosis]
MSAFCSEVSLIASLAALRSASTEAIPSVVAGSTEWVMMKRAALPSGDTIRLKPS